MKKQRISVKVADLTTNKGQLGWLPSNPRQWTQDDVERTKKSLETDPDFLEERPILVIKDGKKWIAFAGNLRTTALKELQPYWDEVGVVQYIPETEEDKHTIKRRAMLDNGSFGAWDFDALANEWDDEPLTDWGVPAWDTKEETDALAGEGEDNYSRKIEVPIYEPTGEKVPIKECYDKAKYDELITEIDKDASLSSDEKEFLKDAAGRHIVFNYARIADYYANARPDVQRLMEKSALVIIDFDKAIENGFVTMAHKIADIYTNDYDEE